MKLIPTAKSIRIRIVSGGVEHSSVDSLRNHYSPDDIIKLLTDGRLHKWLLQKGESRAAESAAALAGQTLTADSPEVYAIMGAIYGIENPTKESIAAELKNRYPVSYSYFCIAVREFPDFDSALAAYKNSGSKADDSTWATIFEDLLKSMPVLSMLSIFKHDGDSIPLAKSAWFKIFKSSVDKATPSELYNIALASWDNNIFPSHAVEWMRLSASRGNYAANIWCEKHDTEPIFKQFFADIRGFRKKCEERHDSLICFLRALSRLSYTDGRPFEFEFEDSHEYSKYLELYQAHWYRVHSVDMFYVKDLRIISSKHPGFPPHVLQEDLKILNSIEALALCIARYVQSELRNGK